MNYQSLPDHIWRLALLENLADDHWQEDTALPQFNPAYTHNKYMRASQIQDRTNV